MKEKEAEILRLLMEAKALIECGSEFAVGDMSFLYDELELLQGNTESLIEKLKGNCRLEELREVLHGQPSS